MDQQRVEERGSAYLLVIVISNNESSNKMFNKDEVALSSKFRADVILKWCFYQWLSFVYYILASESRFQTLYLIRSL